MQCGCVTHILQATTLHIPESIITLTQSCAYLLQLNTQPGQILSKVGASLISLPHVDLHEVQLGFMRRQPPLQLSTLLSPLVLLHLQEPNLSSALMTLQHKQGRSQAEQTCTDENCSTGRLQAEYMCLDKIAAQAAHKQNRVMCTPSLTALPLGSRRPAASLKSGQIQSGQSQNKCRHAFAIACCLAQQHQLCLHFNMEK